MGTITAWSNFSKRKNSTKQPTGAGTTLTGTLKDDTSLANPVFILTGDNWAYNYLQYAGQYYFVDDVVSLHNGLTEFHCSKDYLATYKSNIQASSQFVLYYSHNNTEISDKRLSTQTTQTTESDSGAFDNFGKGSCYVISVIGKDSVSQFAISLSDLKGIVGQSFLDTLGNQIDATPLPATDSLVDYAQYIKDLLSNEALTFTYVGSIAECIRNCYCLPITYTAWGGTSETIYIGKATSGKTGMALAQNERFLHDSATVAIPWQANDWRRNSPYHEIYLYIPCIGLTTISASDVAGEIALHVDLTLDKISGDTIINVGTASKVLAQYTTNVAVNYPIGYSAVNPTTALTTVAGAVGALSGAANPAVSAIMAGLGLANVIQPQAETIGSNGGGAFLGLIDYSANKVYCFTIFHDTNVTPSSVSSVIGTPYNGVMSLSGISGYVQTANASVDIAGLGTDKDIVNNYLNGGIYIE